MEKKTVKIGEYINMKFERDQEISILKIKIRKAHAELSILQEVLDLVETSPHWNAEKAMKMIKQQTRYGMHTLEETK